MIKKFEFYHGVVFTKLVHNSNDFVSIKPFPTESNASYILNDTKGIYIKHSTKRMSPWHFSVNNTHFHEIHQMRKLFNVFLVFVCGEDGVVALSFSEFQYILDEKGKAEWISVSRSARKEYSIKGSLRRLNHKISRNDFIEKILGIV